MIDTLLEDSSIESASDTRIKATTDCGVAPNERFDGEQKERRNALAWNAENVDHLNDGLSPREARVNFAEISTPDSYYSDTILSKKYDNCSMPVDTDHERIVGIHSIDGETLMIRFREVPWAC